MNMVGGIGFLAAMLSCRRPSALVHPGLLPSPWSCIPRPPCCPSPLCSRVHQIRAASFQSWLCGAGRPYARSALLHSPRWSRLASPCAAPLSGLRRDHARHVSTGASPSWLLAPACGQSNGKKILAYSTIANPLIIACAGMATPAAITAAILLIISTRLPRASFSAGTIEQHIGSRDIESTRPVQDHAPRGGHTLFGIVTMMLPFSLFASGSPSKRPPGPGLHARARGAHRLRQRPHRAVLGPLGRPAPRQRPAERQAPRPRAPRRHHELRPAHAPLRRHRPLPLRAVDLQRHRTEHRLAVRG
ncbi:MAG: hypothetical protein ACLSHC_03655 [Bilophila wadsworthia]